MTLEPAPEWSALSLRGLQEVTVQAMRPQDVPVTAELYGALIEAHLRQGALPRALGVCAHAMNSGTPPPLPALQPLITALVEGGQVVISRILALEIASAFP